MRSEPRPLPYQYGQFHETFLYSPYNYEIPVTLPYDLVRLHQERYCLSMQLADCVTYLRALREKHIKNARQLNIESTLSRKKRKKLQQTRRHLNVEIRNRERDEQAILNNLQNCETNIILASMKAYYLANASFHASAPTSTPILYTPTIRSHSGSEGTDLTWDGCTDDSAVSSFERGDSIPLPFDELAPDSCTEGFGCDLATAEDVKRPSLLSRNAVEMSYPPPVPPKTAQSQFRQSKILSPEAAVFQPVYPRITLRDERFQSQFKRLSLSNTTAIKAKELLLKRRTSAAETTPILRRFSIDLQFSPEHLHGQMWCNSTPQPNPHKGAAVQRRLNSL